MLETVAVMFLVIIPSIILLLQGEVEVEVLIGLVVLAQEDIEIPTDQKLLVEAALLKPL